MYSHKFAIVLCVIVAVMAYHSKNNYNDDLRLIDSIYNEPSCTSQGGLCVIAADCPIGALTEKRGLCPEQRSKGVECCYGLSERESRCKKRGGQCAPKCIDRLTQDQATDCPKDTVCCTLVL